MFFLLAMLLFQDTNTDAAQRNEEDVIYFKPLTEGSEIRLGNFQIIVPEGIHYANEEHVPLMLPLTGATQIPNCVGIFYSNAANWNYSVVVQHYPDQAFLLEPQIPQNQFIDFFKKYHLYRNIPFDGQADVVIPPTYQREENSFTLGMQYTEEDHTLVIIKKIYATEHGALVLSYKGVDEAYITEPEAPDKVLNSIAVMSDFNTTSFSDAAPMSYLQFLGFNPQVTLTDAAMAQEDMDQGFLLLSILLGLTGVALLIFALRLRKKPSAQTA